MGGGYGRREVCALPVGSVCGVSVPSSRRYDGTDTPQPRQQSHEAVRDLVQRPTSVPRPLSLSWVPAESCSLLDDVGPVSRRVRVEEPEKIVQHLLSAAFDVGEDGFDVAEKVMSSSACECSTFVVARVE